MLYYTYMIVIFVVWMLVDVSVLRRFRSIRSTRELIAYHYITYSKITISICYIIAQKTILKTNYNMLYYINFLIVFIL